MSDAYYEESQKLSNIKDFLRNQDVDINFDEFKVKLNDFVNSYETLLEQTKVITKISDRLQNKLNKVNDEIKATNKKLKETIDELTLTKIDRKAKFIAYIAVIILFLVSSVFIEPSIDYVASNMYVSLLFKLGITLLLKPFEEVFEHFLLKRAGFQLKDNNLEELNLK